MTVPDMPICTDRTTSPVLQRGDRQAESQQEDDSAEGGAPSFYSRDQVGPYGGVPYGRWGALWWSAFRCPWDNLTNWMASWPGMWWRVLSGALEAALLGAT